MERGAAASADRGWPVTDVPADADTEAEVLSACLQFPGDILDGVRELLPAGDSFYDLRHRYIWSAILLQDDAGDAIDAVSVRVRLQAMPKQNGRGVEDVLAEAGGAGYLFELAIRAASSGNTLYHAQRLADLRLKRRLFALGDDLRRRALSPVDSGAGIAEDFRRDLDAAIASGTRQDLVLMQGLMDRVVADLKRRQFGQSPGLSTGWSRFDAFTGGLMPSDLVILAARPSMGKTAWATNLILNMAALGQPVGVFSLETDEDGLALRILGTASGTNTAGLRNKSLSAAAMERVYHDGETAGRLPIVFDFRPDLGIADLRASARRMASAHGVRMLVVDYLQFMRPGKAERREAAFADISRGLKVVAKELKVPVLVLSQLNRAVEQRGGEKIPQLSDLRESGAIEQDADVVMFLHRPGYYDRAISKGPTSLFIAKFRNGPTGTLNFDLNLTSGKFTETGYDGQPDPEEPTGFRSSGDDTWRQESF